MKSSIFLSLAVLTFLLSCRKDPTINLELPIEPEPINFDLVKTEGSWWKYDWYKIDSLGNETLTSEKDCVYVVGDTLINGEIYTHFKGDYYVFGSYDWIWRDSAHYIIDASSKKLFSMISGIDTLETLYLTEFTNHIITNGIESQVTVPAGTFSAFDSEQHFRSPDNSPFTNCNDVWIKHTKFSNGIGIISSQTGYITQIKEQCGYEESRLTAYFIAE